MLLTEVVCNIYGNEFMNGSNDLKYIMFNKLDVWKNKIKQYIGPHNQSGSHVGLDRLDDTHI